MNIKRKTILDIQKLKGKQPIVALTAYTAPIARILDNHADILLVGDTVGMVIYGMDSTLPVTVDMMVNHGQAVVKSSKSSLIVVDMPFSSYEASKEEAFKNAARILRETGCVAIKLEGGQIQAETIEFLTKRGIPVIAHIGLLPQHVNVTSGYKYQGQEAIAATQILQDAIAVQNAGAFAVVMECIPQELAKQITNELAIPTIGIGASNSCDGQILVIDDMLGLFESSPSFVKQYVNLSEIIDNAANQYKQDVQAKKFPNNL
jgi:3-methyl-2-oxobutanoate hydroxymethyltransferase